MSPHRGAKYPLSEFPGWRDMDKHFAAQHPPLTVKARVCLDRPQLLFGITITRDSSGKQIGSCRIYPEEGKYRRFVMFLLTSRFRLNKLLFMLGFFVDSHCSLPPRCKVSEIANATSNIRLP